MSAGRLTRGEESFQAYVTSRHSVYTVGEAIDLTFWVRGGDEVVTLDFEILDAANRPVAEKRPNRMSLSLSRAQGLDGRLRDGDIPAGPHYAETIPDLRAWYALDEPGTYRLSFAGERKQPDGSFRRLASNILILQIREQPDPTDRVIPLSDVWALDMPGTRPMNRVMKGDPPVYEAPEGQLVEEIRRALDYDPSKHPTAEPGFAVAGEGMEALHDAHAVLVGGRHPREAFRSDDVVSVVFYSHLYGSYVHLNQIAVRGKIVDVTFRVVPHLTREVTNHIAIIPLGRLPKGRIQVDVQLELSAEASRLDVGEVTGRIVSRSFLFSVAD